MVPLELGLVTVKSTNGGMLGSVGLFMIVDLQQLYVVALQRHLWPEGLTLLSRFGRLKIIGLEGRDAAEGRARSGNKAV